MCTVRNVSITAAADTVFIFITFSLKLLNLQCLVRYSYTFIDFLSVPCITVVRISTPIIML